MGRLLSAGRTAQELGVVEKTIYRWIGSGELPAVKKGSMWLVDVDVARSVQALRPSGMRAARFELDELRERVAVLERELEFERSRRTVSL